MEVPMLGGEAGVGSIPSRSETVAAEDVFSVALGAARAVNALIGRAGDMAVSPQAAVGWYEAYRDARTQLEILDWYLITEGYRTPGLALPYGSPLGLLCAWDAYLRRVLTFVVPTTALTLDSLAMTGALPRH
jgi:hypothetical protein